MVISRETSCRQPRETPLIMMAAPAVSEARNVMIAITVTSAREAIASGGTSGTSRRGMTRSCSEPGLVGGSAMTRLIIDMQSAIAEHEAAGAVELVHESEVVGRDKDGGSGAVQLEKQPQQAPGE